MGCCNSKEQTKAPPPRQKPPTPREVVPEVPKKSPHEERIERINAARSSPFRYDRCTVEGGEVRPCFEEGLVYRIIKGDAWYIYNDSLEYEAYVDYRFAPGSNITAGERTTIEHCEDGWIRAHVVVYPLETVHYISGSYTGYKSGITAKPLSVEYRTRACKDSNSVVLSELEAVERLANGETDEEVILKRCIEQNTPYVDVNFKPTAEMLSRKDVDSRQIEEIPIKRPTQYLEPSKRSQADAIKGAIVPHSIDSGLLGDCWLACAAATLAEKEKTVAALFSKTKAEERKVGAYRVETSKNGWWRSVIVDDYLPTISDMPAYARITDDARELWVSLFQKAYAKSHGSYATITGGDALHAIQDFTGAPTYRFDKEWENAAINYDAARSLAEKLVSYSESGYTLVLSTPGVSSTTYLGSKCESDPAAFKAKYEGVGLRNGYTYYVSRAVAVKANGDDVLLLKVHNPWNAKSTWTGAWSAGSAEWRQNPAAASTCDAAKDAHDGSFWISLEDAVNYFDGGGVIYTQPASAIDYRVKGHFADTQPSFALEVHAAEPVELMLVLSQPDKRGATEAAAKRLAPIMLSVAKHDGSRYRVEKNSSWDAVAPSTDYNFMVARDVALKYTFEPSDSPYLIVPRIHRKGVKEGYDRPYVVGIISSKPLDGKVNIAVKNIDGENRVFKNIVAFAADDMTSVEAEHQQHRTGEFATVSVSDTISSAPNAIVTKSEPIVEKSESDAISNEGADDAEEEAEVSVHEVETEVAPLVEADAAERPAPTPRDDEAATDSQAQGTRPRDSDSDSLQEL